MLAPQPYGSAGDTVGDRADLANWIASQGPYVAYTYSYPHKTAYRTIKPISLERVWAEERRAALFLYFHVPFCESRCGYCNLFSHASDPGHLGRAYVDALARQVRRVRRALGEAVFARVAIGGGTPTQLGRELLERICDLAESELGTSLQELPVSLETSPATATEERLEVAVERGVDRISIGVQSLRDEELSALGRRQGADLARSALDRIRALSFDTLNVDLIYGIPGQTVSSWLETIRSALRWCPEELYLYPLYIRPLTGLARCREVWSDHRLELYRAGRDLLRSEGYRQLSMRFFQRRDAACAEGPRYSCQEDGMVGLGCGARSYTRELHYSDDWAVGASGVRVILGEWVARGEEDFDQVRHGYYLDGEDQRVRYLVKSLLRVEGLDRVAYRDCFGGDVVDDFPRLRSLEELALGQLRGDRVTLTARGIELSDCLGPWLYSERALGLMGGFEVR